MTRPARFPWATLAVGASASLAVSTRSSVYASLAHFRDTVRRMGWPEHAQPRFELDWRQDGSVTITRIEDGPLARGRAAPISLEQLGTGQLLMALDHHLMHKQPGQLVPLDLLERARAHDKLYGTRVEAKMAASDFPDLDVPDEPVAPPVPQQRRRATDKPNTPIPPRAIDPDGPANDYLAQRLKQACNTSVC